MNGYRVKDTGHGYQVQKYYPVAGCWWNLGPEFDSWVKAYDYSDLRQLADSA